MSEIRLILIDSQSTLKGTIHGSIGDACIAALSAEPETIVELGAALARFQKPLDDKSPFSWFHPASFIDTRPWDAGIMIIDLAARIVSCESTYSRPGPTGHVSYHDGTCATDIYLTYRVPEDWIFLDSIEVYEALCEERRKQRAAIAPLDVRAVLYGRPLLEFIVAQTSVCDRPQHSIQALTQSIELSNAIDSNDAPHGKVSAIHARWLMTPREDLRGPQAEEDDVHEGRGARHAGIERRRAEG